MVHPQHHCTLLWLLAVAAVDPGDRQEPLMAQCSRKYFQNLWQPGPGLPAQPSSWVLWAPSLMKWRLYTGLGCIIRRLDWGWSIRLQDAGPPAVGGGPQLPAGIGGRLDFLTSWAFHVATSMSNRQGSRPPPREVTREGEWWRGIKVKQSCPQ